MSLPTQVRLNRSFDISKLQSDLESALEKFKALPQAGPYHDGSWKGISLRSIDGDHKNPVAFVEGGLYKDTKVLSFCPYFKEILDSFSFPISTARLLFVPPGKKIGEHVDVGFNWETGIVRLHIPIITHDDVFFYAGGDRLCWKEGEFWFGDFAQPHKLHNKSDIVRVHLVVDCLVNDELLALFPADAVVDIESQTTITRHAPAVDVDDDVRSQCDGFFRLPKSMSPLPLFGRMTVEKNQLQASIFGVPLPFGFDAVEAKKFKYLGNEISLVKGDERGATLSLLNSKTDKTFTIEVMKNVSFLTKTYILFQKTVVGGISWLVKLNSRNQQRWKKITGNV